MKMTGLARLGRDAEVRYTPQGTAVANLSLAFNYGQKGQDGSKPTQWVDATIWGKQAEALAQYLTKGSVHCFTLSDVHIETFQRNNGAGEGVKMAARVDDVELGPRAAGGQPQQPGGGQPRQTSGQPQRPPQQGSEPPMDFDDDIPF